MIDGPDFSLVRARKPACVKVKEETIDTPQFLSLARKISKREWHLFLPCNRIHDGFGKDFPECIMSDVGK